MSFENDISWQVLRRIVHDWAGNSAELSEVTPLEGGCVNTTLSLKTTGGDRAVIKISAHRVNREYQREGEQLRMLARLGLPVPAVHHWHVGNLDNPHSYLLMEFVDGIDLAGARQACAREQFDDLQADLANLVIALHQHVGEAYSRVHAHEEERSDSWPEFYRKVFEPIWREVEKLAILPIKCRKQVNKVHQKLERLIQHHDRPRLIHSDIWATNVLACCGPDGRWRVAALLDPNCKFAHSEAEIAYLELFQTVTPAFMKRYQEEFRLDEGYHRARKKVYQMYPLINHVRLFGAKYVKPLIAAVEQTVPLA